MNMYSSGVKLLLASGMILLCSGCEGRKEVAIAAKDDQIRKQEALIAQERADNQQIRAESQQVSEQNKALADQNSDLVNKNAKIAAENTAATNALARQVAEQDALIKELGKEFAKNQTTNEVRSANDGIHLTVAGSALFDPGKAELKPSAHTVLLNIAKTLKARYPGNYIRIEGHTDSTPIVHTKSAFKDNMALSLARAQSVYEFLRADGGIAAGKMYTAGYGEHQPLVHPEKTAEQRAKNRRVEIVIMPQGVKVQKEQLADASRPAHK